MGGWQFRDYTNLFSSIFNLMNVAIGSGIIGLGNVANTLGYMGYMSFNLVVVIIAIFTLDLICRDAKRVHAWKRLQNIDGRSSENSSMNEKNASELTTSSSDGSFPGTTKNSKFDLEQPLQIASSRDEKAILMAEEKRMELGFRRSLASSEEPMCNSYEDVARIIYGKGCLAVVNLCVLFYLFSCQCSYMTLIKDTIPLILRDFGYNGTGEVNELGEVIIPWYAQGEFLLLWIGCVILIPLGFAKNIDFLGFTSALGMFSMTTFVAMVVSKQPDIKSQCGNITYPLDLKTYNHNITSECEVYAFRWTDDSIFSFGICIFAYMCHTNVLAIFAELRKPTIKRMRGVICGAIIPCTILYSLSAIFAYSSFFNHTQAQLIQLYSYVSSDGKLILMCNILVMICIIFSIPVCMYAARISIWKLMTTILPEHFPKPYNKDFDKHTKRPFPMFTHVSIMLIQYAVIFAVVVSAADFKLFLSLAGVISGSTVIMIFPTLFHLKMDNWCWRSVHNVCCYAVMGLGWVILVFNGSLVLYKQYSK
jgi:amino acid permease